MAVDVSKIPNNNKFDPVRQAILDLQGEISSGVAGVASINNVSGSVTLTGLSPITVSSSTSTSQITVGVSLSVTQNTASGTGTLTYNNGVFTYTPPDLSGFLTEEVNDLTSAVTWANVPDANITQSSVTQHQAALSITESQVSDLGNYLDLDNTGTQTVAGNIVIEGDLTTSGSITYINSTHLDIGDNIIKLNADITSTTAPTEDAGFYVNRGSSPDVSFLWDEQDDRFSTYTSALSTASLYIGSNQVINSSRQFLGSSTISSTVPYFTFSGDSNTGVGRATNNKVSLIAEGVKSLEASDTLVDIPVDLNVDGSITVNGTDVYDNLPTGDIVWSDTDNRFKLGVDLNVGGSATQNIQPLLLANLLSEGYVPYVATGGAGSSTVNSKVSDSWLKINSSTLELDWDTGSPGVYAERNLKMRKDGGGFGTYYEATYAADSVSFLHYASASDIDTAKVGATSTGRVRINDTYNLPAGDGTSGQVLTTNGSGDLSWASAPSGPTTSDLQDVTDNGATTTNAIEVGGGTKVTSSSTSLTRFYVENTGNAEFGSGIFMEVKNAGTTVGSTTMRIDRTGKFQLFNGGAAEVLNFQIDENGDATFTKTISATDLKIESGSSNSIRIGDAFGSGGTATIHNYQKDLYLQYNNGLTDTNLRLGGGGTKCDLRLDDGGGDIHLTGQLLFNRDGKSGNAIAIEHVENSNWAFNFKTSTAGNDNDSGFWVNSDGTPDMRLRRYDGTVRVLLHSNGTSYLNGGNVVVNGTTTSYNFEVNGTSYISGNFYTGSTNYFGGLVRLTGTSSSNSQLDLPLTWGALRWYDGSTFKGGIGTASWGGLGSGDDLGFYLNTGTNFHIGAQDNEFVTFQSSTSQVGIGVVNDIRAKLHINSSNVVPDANAPQDDSKLVISGVDGNMDLFSTDDNTTVSNSIGFGRYNASTGALIHKFGIVSWANTGSTGSNTGDRISFHYGGNKNAWSNSELFTIKAGGEIGIGTDSPDKQLTFVQAADDAIQIRRYTTSQGNPAEGTGISWTWSSLTTDDETWAAIRAIMPGSGNSHLTFSTTSGDGETNLSPKMWITDVGNVGIGKEPDATYSGYPLQLYGGSQTYIHFSNATHSGNVLNGLVIGNDSGTAYIQQRENQPLQLSTNDTPRITIKGDGKVGIGTTSPTNAKVHISGDASYVGNYGYNTLTLEDASGYPGLNWRQGNSNWLFRKSGATQELELLYSSNASAPTTGTYTRWLSIGADGVFETINYLKARGVRIGRDFSLSNRATVRLDAASTSAPADILFGHTAAANETSWNGVYWSISSRAASDGQKLHVYRGSGNPVGGSESILMTYDPNLRVGINNTSPGNTLDVSGTFRATGHSYFDYRVTIGGTSNAWTSLVLPNGTGDGGLNSGVALSFDGSSYSEMGYRFVANGGNYYQVLYNGSAINWKWFTGSAYDTRMSLSNAGTLTLDGGINTGTVESNIGRINFEMGAYHGIRFRDDSNNNKFKWGHYKSGNYFYIYDYTLSGSAFELYGNGDMILTPGGDVGVKNTSPSYALDVTGTIRASSDIIAFSDARVKENVKTIDNALDKVTQLRGVSYNKIGETEEKIGVIAQEIEKVLPQVVQEDAEGMKSVAYGNIVGVLIESIKELKQEIDELKARLDA